MNPDVNTRTEGFIEDAHGDEAEVIDEEELNKLKELKDLKKLYRDAFNNLKNKKREAQYTQQAIDNAKQQLVEGFESWYDETFESAAEAAAGNMTSGKNKVRINNYNTHLYRHPVGNWTQCMKTSWSRMTMRNEKELIRTTMPCSISVHERRLPNYMPHKKETICDYLTCLQ